VFPVVLGAVGDTYASLSGTAFSVALVIALFGNMVLNYLVGLVAQAYGIAYFPVIVLASLCCMFLLFFVVKKKVAPAHVQ
jgi:fucose permease